jgi:hypothetical protein
MLLFAGDDATVKPRRRTSCGKPAVTPDPSRAGDLDRLGSRDLIALGLSRRTAHLAMIEREGRR